MRRFLIALFLTLIIACLLSACSARSESIHSSKTLGQEFIDLRQAYMDGALSEREYERLKSDLMSSARRR